MPAESLVTILEVGTIVKHAEKGVGVVVPNLKDLCGPGSVMVDFDSIEGDHSCLVAELQVLGKIKTEFNIEKCNGCIFAGRNFCYRYSHSRFSWLFSPNARGKIPKRMYPHCQDEVCQ